MAVDKLVDSQQLDSAITATANAIRAKRKGYGANDPITWNSETGFATAISSFDTWTKPADWPDIEALPLNNNATMCVYMLFDCTTPVRYASVWYVKEMARYENGVLGEWIPASGTISLPDDCDYVVLKVESSDASPKLIFDVNVENGLYNISNNVGSNQPCVWMYGRIAPTTLTEMYQNQTAGFSTLYLERVKLYINDMVKFGYGWQLCCNLKSLIIEGVSDERFNMYSTTINAPLADIVIGKCYLPNGLFDIAAAKSVTFTDAVSETAITINGYNTVEIKSFVFHGDLPVEQINAFFRYAQKLETLDLSGFDMTNTASIMRWMDQKSMLKHFTCWRGMKLSFDVARLAYLTHESLVDILTKLEPVEEMKTITLGNINKSKLTADEIAIATEKGWTVA